MIEPTEQQLQSPENSGTTKPRLVNPRTNETFVLIPIEEYERLKVEDYDDSPWTREELEAVAWEVGQRLGWDDRDGYHEGEPHERRR